MNKLRLIIKNVVKSLTARKAKLNKSPYDCVKQQIMLIHFSNNGKHLDIPFITNFYRNGSVGSSFTQLPEDFMKFMEK